MANSTDLIHHPYQPPEGFEAVQPGVHKASSVLFPDVAAMRSRRWTDKSGYTYGLHGTPTTFTLEERLASLEGGRHGLLVPSGLSAIALVNMALLSSGDEVLVPDNAYGPGKELARQDLARWGITLRTYDAMDVAHLRSLISDRTRLAWLEAPGSVTLEFPDLVGLIGACREAGVPVALDNTWGAGLAFDAFDLPTPDGGRTGVDISVHALTKYPSGGGDVMMGSVTTRELAWHETLMQCHGRLGLGVGANDVELVLRGLPSLHLRYAAQDAAARELARHARSLPAVRQVLHPALPDAPGHGHWQSLCRAAAGLFTVELEEACTRAQVDALVDALQCFRLGYSWGGPMSLVVPYQVRTLRALPTPYRGALLRFAVGLEAIDDLRADLDRAWRSAGL